MKPLEFITIVSSIMDEYHSCQSLLLINLVAKALVGEFDKDFVIKTVKEKTNIVINFNEKE